MSDDNNNDNTNQKIGATITYDSQDALNKAKAYQEKIASQLGYKLKSRPFGPSEQRLGSLNLKLREAALGKASMPFGSSSGGIKTDPYLKNVGSQYAGWHRQNPVNMDSSLNDDAFLQGAYQSLFGRAPDQAGFDYWKADLAKGSSRDSVIANMKLSSEYKDKFVNEAYKNLLGRDAEPGGLDYWSKALTAAATEASIIRDIKRSSEFGNYQQSLLTDKLAAKTPTQILSETYDDQIATYTRALQDAKDEVQGAYGTAEDYAPLLTTDPLIYTQDPEASSLASVNYLASVDPAASSPGIWAQALADAGKAALANVNISNLVDKFVDSYI